MITSVRFPTPVAVVKGEPRCEWKPGERGIREIYLIGEGKWIDFRHDDGTTSFAAAPDGTCLEVSDGQASSTASDGPAPAEQGKKSRRVQR